MTVPGYAVAADGKDLEYYDTVTATELFELKGVKSTTGIIVVDDDTVTLTAANLDGANVSIEGEGYKLAFASDITTPKTTDAHFDGFTYKSTARLQAMSCPSTAKVSNTSLPVKRLLCSS